MIALTLKILRDKRWVLLAWALGIMAMSVFTIIFFPSFSQDDSFEKVIESLPPQLQGLVGDALAFKQLPNYIGQQLYDIRLALLGIIFGIVMAINLTVSEEESGTLKTLQTLPISRLKVVLGKWLALIGMTGVVCLSAIPGVLIGVTLIDEVISISAVIEASLLFWLFTLCFTTLAMMIGFVTGKKGLSIGIASLLAFLNVFLSTLAPSVKEVADIYGYTLFYYYNANTLLAEQPELKQVLVLVLATIVFMIMSIIWYQRRDIRAS